MPGLSEREVPTSPPPAFPVYGLDESWPGARWLDGFGYELGDPPRWVSLAHETIDGDSLITVSTYARRTADARAAQWEQTPLQNVAFDAAHILINMTLPVQSVPRPDGFLPVLTEHATKAAADHAHWPVVQWQLGAAAVAARVWQFAGGWAAITDVVGDVYLSTVGVGAGPENLSFEKSETPAPTTSTWPSRCTRACCQHRGRRPARSTRDGHGSGKTGTQTSCG